MKERMLVLKGKSQIIIIGCFVCNQLMEAGYLEGVRAWDVLLCNRESVREGDSFLCVHCKERLPIFPSLAAGCHLPFSPWRGKI